VVQRDALQLLGTRGWWRKLRIEMNGGVLWGRPRAGSGCSAIDGWMVWGAAWFDIQISTIKRNDVYWSGWLNGSAKDLYSQQVLVRILAGPLAYWLRWISYTFSGKFRASIALDITSSPRLSIFFPFHIHYLYSTHAARVVK
jgi:hypothetical protein